MKRVRISLLHLAPVTGDVGLNRKTLESAVRVAAVDGAKWVITPELFVPG